MLIPRTSGRGAARTALPSYALIRSDLVAFDESGYPSDGHLTAFVMGHLTR
jgi:hypothetical protein